MNNDIKLLKKYVSNENMDEALKKLEEGYPIQYIIGNVEFYDTIIEVNENVLIPRFETEYMVEKIVEKAKNFFKKPPKVIDLGTGSGCIAISLKKHLNCDVTAVDISKKALDVAKKNAKINNVEINFFLHDIKKPYPLKFDLIIANPPYIPKDGYIEEKVKKYEPHMALYAKSSGIYYYKKIISYLNKIANERFMAVFEIGDKQEVLLKKILSKYPYSYYFEKDLTSRIRYLFIINE